MQEIPYNFLPINDQGLFVEIFPNKQTPLMKNYKSCVHSTREYSKCEIEFEEKNKYMIIQVLVIFK